MWLLPTMLGGRRRYRLRISLHNFEIIKEFILHLSVAFRRICVCKSMQVWKWIDCTSDHAIAIATVRRRVAGRFSTCPSSRVGLLPSNTLRRLSSFSVHVQSTPNGRHQARAENQHLMEGNELVLDAAHPNNVPCHSHLARDHSSSK